jgi:hypothetical protein
MLETEAFGAIRFRELMFSGCKVWHIGSQKASYWVAICVILATNLPHIRHQYAANKRQKGGS